MKIKYILVSIILIITCTILHAQSISINSTFTEYSTYDLSDISNISNLASVSIDGSVQWIDKDRIGIARVVLVDEKLEEYLIAEVNKRFSNDTVLSNSSNETLILNNVKPAFLKIIPNNAKITISSIHYTEYPNKSQGGNRNLVSRSTLLRERINRDVDNWNRYNAKHHKHWIAAVNDSNEYSYQNIKSIFYCDQDDYISNGIEYYADGIFEFEDEMNIDNVQDNNDLREITTNQYVSEFDWRNRHGKNWITSLKDQTNPNNPITGNGGCWAFAPVAAVEALGNLYYNRLINFDLSEQEIGVCSGSGSLHSGGSPYGALTFIRDNGVVDETCFPFQNDETISCSEKCTSPAERIKIFDFSTKNIANSDSIKKYLINKGPLVAGYDLSHCHHSMSLIGYKTIEIGDSINYVTPNAGQLCFIDSVIHANDQLIGKTYWIFKNNYGTWWNHHGGLMYAYFPSISNILQYFSSSYYIISTPITSLNYTDADIAVTDEDNDGYYFWGLGLKPSHCPVCCPDIPDGDDSDPTVGEMDEYGNFLPYVFLYSTDTITTSQTWNTDRQSCNNIVITNHAYLSIYQSTFTMNPAAKIIIKSGAGLVITGGEIINANILVESGGLLHLQQGATLNTKGKGTIDVKLGGIFNIQSSCGIEID